MEDVLRTSSHYYLIKCDVQDDLNEMPASSNTDAFVELLIFFAISNLHEL